MAFSSAITYIVVNQSKNIIQQYERKSFKGSARRVVTVGKEGNETMQLHKSQGFFTMRCISKGLVPFSIRLNSNRKDISIGARGIIRRAERQLLQQRVRDINRVLQHNREGIASSKSRLFSLVTKPQHPTAVQRVH